MRTITSLAVVAILLTTVAAPAQNRKMYPNDTVPRERLTTTAEMFALLDTTLPSIQPILSAVRSANLSRASQLFLDHLRHRSSPRYFFDPATAPNRSRTYAERYAQDAAFMKDKAIDFQETYGTDVDWLVPGRDLRGRPHTPNTVRSLARHLYAENYAILYHQSGDERFVRYQMDLLRDFLSDYEAGKTETGGNDIFERFYAGHRIRNLMMFHQLMLASDALTVDEHLLLVRTFLLHGAKVIDACSKFNWGNHQLVGLCALYEMTLMYPEFPVMREWNQRVADLMLEHLEKEVETDGFQFERASHYFKLDILNYFRAFRLAEVNRTPVPSWAQDRFRRMFHAIVAVLQPDGAMPPLQDAQDSYIGNRNLDEARERLRASETSNSAELVDPAEAPFLALGAYLFRDPALKHFGSRELHGAFTWFLDTDAPDVYRSLTSTPPAFTSVALRETGYYVMRSGWGPNASMLVIDGGRAVEKPDHTHGGILGLIAYADGAPALPNYRVQYSSPSYPYLKNSWVKNVALADSLEQGRGWFPNAARTGFGKWAWLPTPTVTQWMAGRDVDLLSATHDGFDSIGVQYRRSVVFLKPYGWVVEDRFRGSADGHTAQQIWQGTYTTIAPGRLRSRNLDVVLPASSGTSIVAGGGHGTTSAIFQTKPWRAHRFVTALLPTVAGKPQLAKVTSSTSAGLRIDRADTTDIVRFGPSPDPATPDVQTDAVVAVLRTVKGRPVLAVVANARQLTWGGLLLKSDESVTLEIRRGADGLWTGTVIGDRAAKLTFSNPDGGSSVIHTNPDQPFSVRW